MPFTQYEIKSIWKDLYKVAKERLGGLKNSNGIISGFNSNIDAVIAIDGKFIEKWVSELNIDKKQLFSAKNRSIDSEMDVIRGLVRCFKDGLAEEWLIKDESVFGWMHKNIGYDTLQVGGQAGIIANTAAICGVDPVYVHCSSLPKLQSELFLDLENLYSFDEYANPRKAYSIDRSKDIPLTHWILEFSKNDSFEVFGEKYVCPKANRFIATYDPLNFELHVDDSFNQGILKNNNPLDFIILSGYHLLSKVLPNGNSGLERIDKSIEVLNGWKAKNPEVCLHLELASTQDIDIRKYTAEKLCPIADSLGFNERELIDILDIIGAEELALRCHKNTHSPILFQGLVKLFHHTLCERIQLHMFGLYITISKKNAKISPEDNLKGMILAATIAAAKAATGTVYVAENLTWAFDKEISSVSVNELEMLTEYIGENYGSNTLTTEGIYLGEDFDIIVVPTIIIDNPVTLVGMGDTISSISLLGTKFLSEV